MYVVMLLAGLLVALSCLSACGPKKKPETAPEAKTPTQSDADTLAQLQEEIRKLKADIKELSTDHKQLSENIYCLLDILEKRTALHHDILRQHNLLTEGQNLKLQVFDTGHQPTKKLEMPSPDALWQKAGEAFKKERYTEAILGYEEFLTREPETSRFNETLFRIGECYQALEDHASAITTYEEIIQGQATKEDIASAWLKIAQCYEVRTQFNEAFEIYRRLVEDFKGTDAAKKAMNKLEK